MGRVAAPLASAAIDVAFRVVSGQPLGQATFAAVGDVAGAIVGSAIGAVAGPVGAFVGGVAGSMVGGTLADAIYGAFFPSRATILFPEIQYPPAFYGGQSKGVSYNVAGLLTTKQGYLNFRGQATGPIAGVVVGYTAWTRGYWLPPIVVIDDIGNRCGLLSWDQSPNEPQDNNAPTEVSGGFRITSITRVDGQSDLGGNPPALSINNPSAYLPKYHPGNQESGVSSAIPTPKNKTAPITNYFPTGLIDGGSPRGDSPKWVGHGYPAPQKNPSPASTPSNLGGNLPEVAPQTDLSRNPQNQSIPDINPGYSGTNQGGSGTIVVFPRQNPPSPIPTTQEIVLPPDKHKKTPPIAIPQTQPLPQADPKPTTPPIAIPQTQPLPQADPTTTPPTNTTDNPCQDPCLIYISNQIKENKIELVDLTVPIFDYCEDVGKAKFTSRQIQVIKGTELQEGAKFERIALLEALQCNQSNQEQVCYAAVPDSWQIRPEGHRPQLVIQFGEDLGNGKVGAPMYAITIPHYKGNKLKSSPVPRYKKGSWEEILTLSDNSKVTVNAYNKSEAEKVINACKQILTPQSLTHSYSKGGAISKTFKEIVVVPKMAKYFSTGRKSMIPDWIVRF